jgi:hypothetical protein
MNLTRKEKAARFYTLFSVAAIFGLILAVLFLFTRLGNEQQKSQALSDKIDAMSKTHEAEILNLNKKLGTSQSQLVTQENLTKQYKEELTKKDAAFEKERKKYKLEIKSRDDLIAILRGSTTGGQSGTSGGNCTTKNGEPPKADYFWEDSLGRFKLKDPDIFVKNNENFDYKLKFAIKGEIFTDKEGNIQTRKVELQEVIGEDNTPVENSKFEIASNDFKYTNDNEKRQKIWSDIFTLRPIGTFDIALMPGIGLEILNLGKLVDYSNIGLYTKLSADLSDPLGGSLQNSRMGIGINYHIVPPMLKTNFAIGASLNLPFNQLNNPILTVDAILYLTEDLNPFME